MISIIVPCYNAEKTIENCLNSLLKQQTKKSFEIIVIDDGSGDYTRFIVRKIAKKNKRIRYFWEKNSGPAVARNFGAKKARGEIIVFVDSDCIAEKNWLEEITKPIKENIVGAQGRYRCNQKELIARLIQLEIEKNYEKMEKADFIDFIGSYSAAYLKKVFEEMNGFCTEFPIASGEDTELAFRINEKGYKMVFAPKAIVWHTHPKTIGHYLRIKFYRAAWRIKVYRKHSKKIVKDSYTSQTTKLQISLFFLGCLFFLLGIFIKKLWLLGLFSLIAIIATGIPFAVWCLRKDLKVALIFPFIVFLRTLYFSIGIIGGIIREYFK